MGQPGSKRGGNGLNSHPCASQMARENACWTLFCPTFGTKWAHFHAFLDFGWANRGENGAKMTSFHLFVHPKWSNIIFGKKRFSPLFDPFAAPGAPNFKAFCHFRRAKSGHHWLKTGENHLFWHPTWSRSGFENGHFFGPGGPRGPILAPSGFGSSWQLFAA